MFGTEADSEVLYSDYKDISGVKYPMKVTSYVEGKKAIELEITKIEFTEKLDDSIFAKPK